MKRKKDSQVGIAYEYLKKNIINYQLTPESSLCDLKIATKLEMSRASVREAILLLEIDGLVQLNDKNKVIVTPISIDDVLDILDVRCVLEAEAVRRIIQHGWLTPEQEKELQYIQTNMSNCTIDMIDKHYDYDDTFHAKLAEASGSKRIIKILEQMRIQMQRARWLNVVYPNRFIEASSEHEAILNALLAHDEKTIYALIHRHYENSRNTFSKILEDQKVLSAMAMVSNFCSSEKSNT